MTAPPDGFDAVRAGIATAAVWTPPGQSAPPPAAAGRDHGHDGADAPYKTQRLPPDCPVIALGTEGHIFHYLTKLGDHRAVKDEKHQQSILAAMFEPFAKEYLWQHWPRKTQDKETEVWITTGWKPEELSCALRTEAALKGHWSPLDQLRGAGAWKGAEGELILHTGRKLLIVPAEKPSGRPRIPWREADVGLQGELVYPTATPGLSPATGPERPSAGNPLEVDARSATAADTVLKMLSMWRTRRPEIDPMLILGWIGLSMMAGAVDWRVVMWITGGFGTGKSWLLDFIKGLLGPNGILKVSDPTPAAIRQIVGQASRTVAIQAATF